MWCKFETLPQTSPGQRLSIRPFRLKKVRLLPLTNGLWRVNELRKYEKSISTQIPQGSGQHFESFQGLYDKTILLECVVKVTSKSRNSPSLNRFSKSGLFRACCSLLVDYSWEQKIQIIFSFFWRYQHTICKTCPKSLLKVTLPYRTKLCRT